MNIKIADLKFKNALSKRKSTAKIILHHAAGSGMTIQQIHNMHINSKGWSGVGYHFYIRKNGEIWQGRPIDALGAHCKNNNSDSIGICFEGNFENEKMNDIQINAGKELISYILGKYPKLKIYGHRDFNATACPGRNFPWNKIIGGSSGGTITINKKEDGNVNTLKNGSKGTDVKILQTLLNLGGANLTVDGSFGGGTESAVKAFQKEKNLTADGIVGSNTWAALATVKTESNSAEISALKTKIANAQKALA